MPRFSDDFLSSLYEACDIEQVISPYTDLKRRGRTLVGLCPFHNERTPSFTVYPDTHSFYCFGCGAAGTAIQFVQRAENLDFVEAVKLLCDRFNVLMPTEGPDSSIAEKKRRMLQINKEAARFFNQCLFEPQGRQGLEYLLFRGYSKKTITHFGMGFAPNEWRALLDHMRAKGYSYEELYEANLARKSEKGGKTRFYDNFRNRVMVPIIDVRGNVVAFGGRVLDDSKPKYINTSDTLVYKKSLGVFGLNFAKNSDKRSLILVEGYMDAISLHQAGFDNSIACLGTALTSEMAHLISRYCDEVILSYDADEAGQRATARAIEIFGTIGMKIRVVKLSGGKDPDEILKKYGAERYRSIIEGASNELEFELLKRKADYDLNTEDGRLKYLTAACDILAESRNPIAIDIYASKLADELGAEKQTVIGRVRSVQAAAERSRKRNKQRDDMASAVDNVRRKYNSPVSTKAVKAQERILTIFCGNPDFYPILSDLEEDRFSDAELRDIFRLLKERARDGLSLEEQYVSAELDRQRFERLAGLIHRDRNLPSSKDELNECISVLQNTDNKNNQPDISKLSDEEYLALFRKDERNDHG